MKSEWGQSQREREESIRSKSYLLPWFHVALQNLFMRKAYDVVVETEMKMMFIDWKQCISRVCPRIVYNIYKPATVLPTVVIEKRYFALLLRWRSLLWCFLIREISFLLQKQLFLKARRKLRMSMWVWYRRSISTFLKKLTAAWRDFNFHLSGK